MFTEEEKEQIAMASRRQIAQAGFFYELRKAWKENPTAYQGGVLCALTAIGKQIAPIVVDAYTSIDQAEENGRNYARQLFDHCSSFESIDGPYRSE